MLTRQKLFDTIATHLLTQNARSLRQGGTSCVYRGAGNLRCAVGCLIPDALYGGDIENIHSLDLYAGVLELDVEGTVRPSLTRVSEHLRKLVAPEDRQVMARFQTLHDKLEPAGWPDALRRLAGEFNLSAEVVETFGQPKAEGVPC